LGIFLLVGNFHSQQKRGFRRQQKRGGVFQAGDKIIFKTQNENEITYSVVEIFPNGQVYRLN
jgi:hypothetical protein